MDAGGLSVFDGDQDDHELSLEAVQEGFSMKLRDETDLVAFSDDPVGVVWETMRTAHVSLWLHPATLQKSRESDQQPLFAEASRRSPSCERSGSAWR